MFKILATNLILYLNNRIQFCRSSRYEKMEIIIHHDITDIFFSILAKKADYTRDTKS